MEIINNNPKINKEITNEVHHKKKVVFIMGATGTGKSRLSIDVATRFPAEVINSDKIQVYKGLDIVTNKISEAERQGVLHHLLGDVHPDADFSAHDFCLRTLSAVDSIVGSGKLPIIVGGSNNYIESLVEGPAFDFRSKYECCFIWLDVSTPVLHSHVSKRVDQMVREGLVEEVRDIFVPGADYNKGIRRAIGVPEMDAYLQLEKDADEVKRETLLRVAIEAIKVNTCELTCCQIGKIRRLRDELGWPMCHMDATHVFEKSGKELHAAWEKLVRKPSLEIVGNFLKQGVKTAPKENGKIAPKENGEIGAKENGKIGAKEDGKFGAKKDEKIAALETAFFASIVVAPQTALSVNGN